MNFGPTTIETYGEDRVFVSIDARGGYVATHGWVEATEVPAREAIERWHDGGHGVKHFVFSAFKSKGATAFTWVLAAIDRFSLFVWHTVPPIQFQSPSS